MFDYIIFLLILYSVPILRLSFFFIPPFQSRFIGKFNSFIGRFEWLVRGFRDTVILAVLLFFTALAGYDHNFSSAFYFAPFIFLSLFSIARHKFHLRRMIKFGIKNKFIHPAKFFECYYSGFGVFPVKTSSFSGSEIIPHNCSFKAKTPSKLCFWPVIYAMLNTFTLARMVAYAQKRKGPEFCRETASAVATIWGARLAHLGKMSVVAEGLEKLSNLSGKFIFAFNHKSSLDFALGPFALAKTKHNLKFMAARDHFLDNIFLYNLLGKAMLSVGTIFVDRLSKKASPTASVSTAVSELVNLPIGIGIFPQGTRAYGNVNAEGKRMDAGYYTAGSAERLKKEGAHLKKGASFIAVLAAVQMKKLERPFVNIIPVGISGTATAMPKNGIFLQTGASVLIKIGEPIIISKSDVKNIEEGSPEYLQFAESIHKKLDDSLKDTLGIHAELEHRFFTDIRKILPITEMEHLTIAMKQWRSEDYLIYSLLDCIYSTKPKYWQAFLRELSHLIISQAPRESLLQFKGRVADKLTAG